MVTTKSITTVALLSIDPEFANAILEGRKTVEFRKNRFSKSIKYVLLYSTMPEGFIVGLVELKRIHRAAPSSLWQSFGSRGCIVEERFFNYYKNNSSGVALEIENVWKLKTPRSLSESGVVRAPQSFSYMEIESFDFLGPLTKIQNKKHVA